MPFSVEEVKRITNSCRTCAEIKSRFHKPKTGVLIKATQPFERLNLDFKGPLQSKTRNLYILMVVDEYSRFPFAFPCSDISCCNYTMPLLTIRHLWSSCLYTFGLRGFFHVRAASTISTGTKSRYKPDNSL